MTSSERSTHRERQRRRGPGAEALDERTRGVEEEAGGPRRVVRLAAARAPLPRHPEDHRHGEEEGDAGGGDRGHSDR